MTNEKDFYDILRSKFNSQDVPFSDEENWNSMRKMIDESRKARDRAIWLLTSIGLLICAGAAFAIYSWISEGGNTKTTSSKNTSLHAATHSATSSNVSVSNSKPNLVVSISKSTGNNVQSNNSLANTTILQNSSNKYIIPAKSIHQNYSTGNLHNLKSPKQPPVSANNFASSPATLNVNTVTEKGEVASNLTPKRNESKNLISNNTNSKATSPIEAAIHKTDSVTLDEGLPQRFSDEPRIFRSKKSFVSVDAGVSWSGGWEYGLTTQGHGFYPVMGLGYMHYLKSKLFVKTGLQFSIFDNMNSIPFIIKHESGNVSTVSVINTQDLFYLAIPLQFEYYLGNKNAIGLGGSVSRLIGSSNSGTTYEQYDNNPPINVQQLSHITTLSGYAAWNTTVYLLYKYTFSRKFSIYIMPYFGLTDMKNNSFFGTNLFERDKGFKIVLSYNL